MKQTVFFLKKNDNCGFLMRNVFEIVNVIDFKLDYFFYFSFQQIIISWIYLKNNLIFEKIVIFY